MSSGKKLSITGKAVIATTFALHFFAYAVAFIVLCEYLGKDIAINASSLFICMIC